MTSHELITKLENLKAIHGEGCRVLVSNEIIDDIEYFFCCWRMCRFREYFNIDVKPDSH